MTTTFFLQTIAEGNGSAGRLGKGDQFTKILPCLRHYYPKFISNLDSRYKQKNSYEKIIS
jgi:hypothetical protein